LRAESDFLNLGVLDDLDQVPPRIAEAQAAARLEFDARVLQRLPHAAPVVDHEAEVAAGLAPGRVALGQREKLIAHVEERHPTQTTAQLQLEDAAVEGHGLVDVAHLEGHVVDADHPRHMLSIGFRAWLRSSSSALSGGTASGSRSAA
jgi:hypothetical protein